jgi:hypothetical protein
MKLFESWTKLGDGIELCRFILNNKRYTGIIKDTDISENHIDVRPISIEFEYKKGYERYDMVKLTKDIFDEINLEILDDNRGCDNSAIGCDSCYEPWRNFV